MKLKWLSVFSILVAFVLSLPSLAQAEVHDNANIFSPSAIENANNAMKKMERLHNKQFVVETFAGIPEDQKEASTQNPDTFFKDWMSSRAKELKVNGVYAMICMEPRHLEVAAGKSTISRGDFSESDVKSLYAQLKATLHDKQYDKALTDATDTVERAYTANISEPGNRSTATGGEKEYSSNSTHMPGMPGLPGSSGGGGVSIGSMICLGIAAIIIFSLIKSVFRGNNSGGGYSGGNYPPGGPGQNYGAGGGGFGYGGGGGGGFGRGFLGGLLGGALGGYAADRFDHRNDQSNAGLSQGGGFGGGGGSSSFDSGPSDAGQGFGDSSSGGDFGSSGGGDSGGGGSSGGDF